MSDVARQALEQALLPGRREVRVQIELHRVLLGKLISDRDQLITLARRNLRRSRGVVRGDLAQQWLDEWEALLEGPPEKLVDVFPGEDARSIDLRQVSPFAGALTEAERLAAIEQANADASR